MSNTSTTRSVTGEANEPWGQYRSAVADGVASCADYLGRLEHSLSGEAASDRHYFSTRAHDLYEAARDLARLTHEVEHWLIVCNEPLLGNDGVTLVGGTCELPRGHYGGHDDEPPASLAVQVRNSAQLLMDEAEDTARVVDLLGLRSDQRRAFGFEKEFDPEFHELLDALEQMGSSLVYRAQNASGILHDLANEMPQEEWDDMDQWEDEEDDDFGINPPIEMPQRPAPKVRRARGLDL
jgi:hypothetical protein